MFLKLLLSIMAMDMKVVLDIHDWDEYNKQDGEYKENYYEPGLVLFHLSSLKAIFNHPWGSIYTRKVSKER